MHGGHPMIVRLVYVVFKDLSVLLLFEIFVLNYDRLLSELLGLGFDQRYLATRQLLLSRVNNVID